MLVVGGTRGSGQSPSGPDVHRHRSPSVDDTRRRRHCRLPQRPRGRARHAPTTAVAPRHLLRPPAGAGQGQVAGTHPSCRRSARDVSSIHKRTPRDQTCVTCRWSVTPELLDRSWATPRSVEPNAHMSSSITDVSSFSTVSG